MTMQALGVHSDIFKEGMSTPAGLDTVLLGSPIAVLEFFAMVLTVVYICKLLLQKTDSGVSSPDISSATTSSLSNVSLPSASSQRNVFNQQISFKSNQTSRSSENCFDVGTVISTPKRSLAVRVNRFY